MGFLVSEFISRLENNNNNNNFKVPENNEWEVGSITNYTEGQNKHDDTTCHPIGVLLGRV